MSYEYARIPLKPGVNLICGPNGAGKSSILLGISVAFGQSYTERSKKLSDLIRRGKDIGRVTLVLDNSIREGRRPVRRIRKDQIYLTRVLRRDGKYWFEIDNAHATRAEVLRLLSCFNVDPDNMLIIMHQDMAEQFVVLSPQEKLKLVESAAGLEPYRRNVLEAKRKLSRIVSQEESLSKMLESAAQTLNYWREQYDRYQQKKQLILKRRFLERELAWAEAASREAAVSDLEKRISKRREEFEKIENKIKTSEEAVRQLQEEARNVKETWERLFEERLLLEREKARHESNVLNGKEMLEDLRRWVEQGQKTAKDILQGITLLEDAVKSSNPFSVEEQDLAQWSGTLKFKIESLEESVKKSSQRINDLDSQLAKAKKRTQEINLKMEDLNSQILEKKIDLAILRYRKNELLREREPSKL